MRLGDIQNLYGKSLEMAQMAQAVVTQPDISTRQTARILETERKRKQSQIQESEESSDNADAGLNLNTGLGRHIDLNA